MKGVVGIDLNVHEPPDGQTRAPLTTTLRHALAFVFQPQNEISQPGFLFRDQSNNFVAQAIKDTLPYFLGAVDDDYVSGKARLKRLRRSLYERERTLARFGAMTRDGVNEASTLLAEARDIGLLESDTNPESWEAAVEVLRTAVSAAPEEQLIRYEQSTDQSELIRLNDERAELRRQFSQSQNDLEATKTLLADEGGFARESDEQVSRLVSLRLFSASEEPCCPLCEQPTNGQLPSLETLEAEMQRASEQLERVTRNTPGLEALIIEQEQRVDEFKSLLQENRTALEALRRADDRLMQLRDAASRRSYVIGRISLFLEALPQVADSSDLQTEIFNLKREIEQLEEDLSDEHIQERIDSILSIVSRYLTEWAEQLDLEHQGNPFRLALKSLQVVVDVATGPIRMDRMGSGANWLGCHLIAHLALHHWFVQQSRPVPRFLFLDRPSQVYFPAEQNIETPAVNQDADISLTEQDVDVSLTEQTSNVSVADLDDEDREAVIRMFMLIRNVVEELSPNFQVIITEHADIAEDWYQNAVVERWRHGDALIPAEWLSTESAESTDTDL